MGFDVHPFGDAPPLVLGGVTIAEACKLSGHSDGDTVTHTVADALLGPAGLPDLGTLFPATDERYRGADSMGLLADVAEGRPQHGWWLENVDVTITAETPRPRAARRSDGRQPDRRAGALARAHGCGDRGFGPAQTRRGARRDRPLRRRRGLGGRPPRGS